MSSLIINQIEMEPKVVKDSTVPKGAILAAFSFRKHYNILKKIGKPAANIIPGDPSPEIESFKEWLIKEGADLGKIAYPIYFSDVPGVVYPGALASENIAKDEVIAKIPVNLIMNTSKALYSEIRSIFIENPKLFNKVCNPSYWQSIINL